MTVSVDNAEARSPRYTTELAENAERQSGRGIYRHRIAAGITAEAPVVIHHHVTSGIWPASVLAVTRSAGTGTSGTFDAVDGNDPMPANKAKQYGCELWRCLTAIKRPARRRSTSGSATLSNVYRSPVATLITGCVRVITRHHPPTSGAISRYVVNSVSD